MMDQQLQALLNDLYQQGQANDAQQGDRRQKMLNLEPATAQFISFLVRSSKRMRILEIGTSNGYSAPAQLALLLPKLTPNAPLLADNALSHPDEIAGYLAALRALPDFEQMVIPVGKGLSVAYRA
jgi:predicted O-methyltransferase YrrM